MNSRLLCVLFRGKDLVRFSFSGDAGFSVKVCRSFHTAGSKLQTKSEMSKPSVYVTRKICDEALEILSQKCQVTSWPGSDPVPRNELMQNVRNKDALLCMLTDTIDKEVLDQATDLKVIVTMSVGYDHLDVAEIKKRGIKIGYTPGVLTHATAELTVGLLLATSRRLLEAGEEAKNGGWQSWRPYWMTGPGLENSVVGIVGFGRIGQEVAKRLKPFNVKKFVYFSRTPKPEAESELGAKKVTLNELLSASDFVIATCALTEDTKELFNEAAFKQMKKNAVFVNSSRGGVVDQEALYKALSEGEIWGAGLDVTTPEPLPTDHKLFKLKNCVILPHIGSATIQTRAAMTMMSVENVIAGLEGKTMPTELIL